PPCVKLRPAAYAVGEKLGVAGLENGVRFTFRHRPRADPRPDLRALRSMPRSNSGGDRCRVLVLARVVAQAVCHPLAECLEKQCAIGNLLAGRNATKYQAVGCGLIPGSCAKGVSPVAGPDVACPHCDC